MTCIEMSHRGASYCFHILFRNTQAPCLSISEKNKIAQYFLQNRKCHLLVAVVTASDIIPHSHRKALLTQPQSSCSKNSRPPALSLGSSRIDGMYWVGLAVPVHWTVFNHWKMKMCIFFLTQWKISWIMTFCSLNLKNGTNYEEPIITIIWIQHFLKLSSPQKTLVIWLVLSVSTGS